MCSRCTCAYRNMAKSSPGSVSEPEGQTVFEIQMSIMMLMLIQLFMYI